MITKSPPRWIRTKLGNLECGDWLIIRHRAIGIGTRHYVHHKTGPALATCRNIKQAKAEVRRLAHLLSLPL